AQLGIERHQLLGHDTSFGPAQIGRLASGCQSAAISAPSLTGRGAPFYAAELEDPMKAADLARLTSLGFALCLSATGCAPSTGTPSPFDFGPLDDRPPIGHVDGSTGSKCGNCTGCCQGNRCTPLDQEDEAHCGRRNTACKVCSGTTMCTAGVCVKPT